MARMRFLPLLLVLCACSGGGGGAATTAPAAVQAASSGAASAASGYSPACGGTGGTVYVNAEVEPHIAVDPRNIDHWVGAWQQDRWSGGSARGLRTAVTFDAGATWALADPPFTSCAGGEFTRGTDPWVAFAADGTVYVSALGTTGATFAEGSANAILVSRSADGGRTWSRPLALIRDGGGFFNDKETITADPADARLVYAVWDRLQKSIGGGTWFARTTDSGASWEAARAIYDPGRDSQTISNLIRVLPNGMLVNLFAQLDGPEDAPTSGQVRVIRSADRGTTWSGPVTISTLGSLGARDPATGTAIRDGSVVPQMAVGADGTLHVVWQDARFSGTRDGIAYSRSGDGGLTWSPAVRVNGDPSVTAFTPQVHVRADGTVGISYFDLRPDTPDPATLLTDYWLARSTDGVSWQETRVASSFGLHTAPLAGGQLFLGDYMGLASAADAFLPFYTRTSGDPLNRTDVYWARVGSTTPGLAVREQAKQLVERDAAFARRVAENLASASASRRLRWETP